MRKYYINGRKPLGGELRIGGAKNAVLPILAAACANEGETVIHDCPLISDTMVSIEILKKLGCTVEIDKNTLKINSQNALSHAVPEDCVRQMRSSILFMGAMLTRGGKVEIAMPGGCDLGDRSIDMHIEGLRAMGAKINCVDGCLHCETDGLKGAKIKLPFPSVGATENLLIAATRATGETVIKNAAREPEITDLANYLTSAGADIVGAGTGTIIVRGKKDIFDRTGKVTHSTMPDRIVAGTYLVAAAMTKGEITLTNVRPFDLSPFTARLSEMGCIIKATTDTITLRAPKRLKSVPRIVTKVHPGFPTDMQAQFVAALTIASHRSEVKETIFNGRYRHVTELRKMGASIHLTADKRTFTITGVDRLHGAEVTAHDLRCGAALVLAALAADGETTVTGAEYVERGYADIVGDLRALGAEIRGE